MYNPNISKEMREYIEENHVYDYARLSWENNEPGPDGFVIVQKYAPTNFDSSMCHAIFVYGSKRLYKGCGNVYTFSKYTKVEELDEEYAMKNYFPGFLC